MNETQEPPSDELREPKTVQPPALEDLNGGIPEWGKHDGEIHYDVYPQDYEDQWIKLGWRTSPLGSSDKIWKNGQNYVAQIEAELEKKKRQGDKGSQLVAAQLVQDIYIISYLEFNLYSIDEGPEKVGVLGKTDVKLKLNQQIGTFLRVAAKHRLEHSPYPDPIWILKRNQDWEAYEKEVAKQNRKIQLAKDQVTDPPEPSSSTGEGGGSDCVEPCSDIGLQKLP